MKFKSTRRAAWKEHLEMILEDINGKFDLLLEGQQALSEKIDRVEINLKDEIRQVDQSVTGVAVNLADHRRDTEAHRKSGRVRED